MIKGRDAADRRDRCERCVYYKGVVYLGDERYVECPELPGGKSGRVKTYKGCGCFMPAEDDGNRQCVLF